MIKYGSHVAVLEDGIIRFGVIAAVGEGVYMLNGDLGYISVGQDDVHGKVLAIAPWWGKLADLIGL
jgi:hypothetical protein